jgi:hypothetical protein
MMRSDPVAPVGAEKPFPRGMKCAVAIAANAGIDPSGPTESRGQTCSKIDGASNLATRDACYLGLLRRRPRFCLWVAQNSA